MRGRDFNRFLFPTAITDRKTAANAIAAGVLIGTILASLSGLAAPILGIRHGDTKTTLLCAATATVMTLVTIGIWKRIWIAPLIGLSVGAALLVWQLTLGKISALVLILPLVGGFWTAMRGIAFYKRSRPPT